VRNFERELMKLARKAVTEIIKGKTKSVHVTAANIDDYLGVPRFRHGEAEREDQVGVVTGLAWTEVGGELLTIEGVMMPGKGRMTVTGNLKEVMKESISERRLMSARAPSISASSRRSSTRATSMCTCRKAQRRRMVRLQVSRWQPRSSRS
jgi:ATP-dependent Lon protease